MKKNFLFSILFLLHALLFAQKNIVEIKNEYDSLAASTSYGNNKEAGKYFDIRGFKMYCEVYGSGEPLLFIHGNGASINAFVKQIPYFSKRYKVIIADSRSQGKSEDKIDSLTYEMMADDYAALLTRMGIDSAYVVGWSDGGINGLLLAMRHPEKVKKLVITGANLQPDSTAISADVMQQVWVPYNMLKQKENKTDLDKKVYKFFKLLVEQPHIPITDLHAIKIPTLVISGDHDVIKPGHSVQIFQNIKKASLWILPNSGHSTLVVYSNEFNLKVDDYLQTPYRKIEGENRNF